VGAAPAAGAGCRLVPPAGARYPPTGARYRVVRYRWRSYGVTTRRYSSHS
jgi:hypothetical protein